VQEPRARGKCDGSETYSENEKRVKDSEVQLKSSEVRWRQLKEVFMIREEVIWANRQCQKNGCVFFSGLSLLAKSERIKNLDPWEW
jgi:hypothetical protein